MAINSKAKGAEGEREIAKILREHGFDEARRGQQFSGKNGDADVIGLEHLHLEVKRNEHLNIDNAYDQSVRDAAVESERKGKDIIPTVFHRKNRRPWLVTLGLEDFIKIYKSATGWENKHV